jgi:poly(3-hydroxybutyrate) depolymerase
VHVIAVCQPSVPTLAAASLMAQANDPRQPRSLTLMGGPIDTRISPTVPNDLAMRNSMMWFRQNVISTVPFSYPGALRRVYPGFVQLTSFISMNFDRHLQLAPAAVRAPGQRRRRQRRLHRRFYDEYLAVMDLTAEFYLQTIQVVFKEHLLPRGLWVSRGRQIEPAGNRDRADDGRGRARRHLRRRPDQGGACADAPHSRVHAVCIGSSRGSATTASSTAASGASRSCRACATSSAPTSG